MWVQYLKKGERDDAQHQMEKKMTIITVQQPKPETGNPVEDFRLVCGEVWGQNYLFQIEGTDNFFEFYVRLNELKLKFYKPVKIEGRIVEHIEVRIDKTGKRYKSGRCKLGRFEYQQ